MTLRETAYDWTLRGLRLTVGPIIASGDSKAARSVGARADALEQLVRWGTEARDPDRPLAWFHAPSVGEALQARAVLRALRHAHPGMQVAFTHFSPSAESFAADLLEAGDVDVAGYLPWDSAPSMRSAVDALRPTLVAFAKSEVWPILTREARAAGVGLALVGASLPPGSTRLSPPARFFLRPAHARLDVVAAVGEDDAERLRGLGVEGDRIEVTGDPAVDAAASRLEERDPDAPYLRPFRGSSRPTVVAGSTWRGDESVLLPAVGDVRKKMPELRLVVAPHEPTPEHVRRLEGELRAKAWETARLGEVEEEGETDADAIIVDRVGILLHLYTVGHVAFVGGGFNEAGLHSVIEPAAAGLPVAFGPKNQNAPAAAELARAGGASEVAGAGGLAVVLGRWLGNAKIRARAAEAAKKYIDRHRGAAERTAKLLARLID